MEPEAGSPFEIDQLLLADLIFPLHEERIFGVVRKSEPIIAFPNDFGPRRRFHDTFKNHSPADVASDHRLFDRYEWRDCEKKNILVHKFLFEC